MKKLTDDSFLQLGADHKLNYLAVQANPKWREFTTYCKVMDTLRIEDIRLPPDVIANMIKDEIWYKKLIKHLNNRRSRHPKLLDIGIHLNPDHRMATVKTHNKTVELLKQALDDFQEIKGRALDAGCGDGRLTKYLLALEFDEVDMFDPSPDGVAVGQLMANVNSVIDRVEKKTF